MFMVRPKRKKNESKLCAYLNITIFFCCFLSHTKMAWLPLLVPFVRLIYVLSGQQSSWNKRDTAYNANKQLNKFGFVEIACALLTNSESIAQNEATELTRLENIVFKLTTERNIFGHMGKRNRGVFFFSLLLLHTISTTTDGLNHYIANYFNYTVLFSFCTPHFLQLFDLINETHRMICLYS